MTLAATPPEACRPKPVATSIDWNTCNGILAHPGLQRDLVRRHAVPVGERTVAHLRRHADRQSGARLLFPPGRIRGPHHRRQSRAQVLMTMGFALVFQDLALLIWGGDPHAIPVPPALSRSFSVGPVIVPA